MMEIPATILAELSAHYPLTDAQISHFNQYRYIKLKDVLPLETLAYFNEVISRKVELLSRDKKGLDQRDTYGKAFLQLMNLWCNDEQIRALIFSKRIAGIASALMQVGGVRLYHDQALFKEPGGGITPWHADQYYWPLSSDKTITAWIPLQAVPAEMGPLEFCAGSHVIEEGRELAISDNSEQQIQQRLRVTDFPVVSEPFDAGEISFHSGWVFHRAGPNLTTEMRRVMTIIYMDKEMVLKQPENDNQIADWETWCPGAQVGAVIDTPLNPVLWQNENV